jgi:hypothetical protein
LEKAEIESKVQAAMGWMKSLKTELGTAKTGENSTDSDNEEIESKLQAILEWIKSLKN